MSNAEVVAAPRSQYVDFWNTVLVPKFVRGLTLHSAKVFPSLAVREGDAVIDAGCGFGDTAIQLARLVGPSGSVLGMDCCDAFLDSRVLHAHPRLNPVHSVRSAWIGCRREALRAG
jgi:2-polyprenyl-3-methyl-5-hydroxy-6-metoxy-1,4-benzoquinol methylase